MNNIFIKRPNLIYWLFTFVVAIGLTLPYLVQEGMFLDGILYSSVSRNLGHGIGSFWFPQFSYHNVGGLPSFHEQPPLVFGIQSVLFYLFGNSIYIEKTYTFLALIISIVLIQRIWKEANIYNKNQIQFGWLSVFLWISVALAFWSFRHNMMENTMGIFTLLSVLYSFKSINKKGSQLLYISLAGVFVFLAVLSKGFPGLFPISIPGLFWIINRNISFKRTITLTSIIILVPTLLIGILLLFPDSNQSLSYYFFDRFLNRVDYMPTIDNRFYILRRLVMELTAPIVIIVITAICFSIFKVKFYDKRNYRMAILFILIGLSGSVPLILTMVQKGFYFTPSLPHFGIGLAFLIVEGLNNTILKINTKKLFPTILKYITISLGVFVIVISIYRFGSYGRHKEIIEDIKKISSIVPENSVVSIPEELWDEYEFTFQGYLMRYGYISISSVSKNEYFITKKSDKSKIPTGYEKIHLNTDKYTLYKLK